MQKPGCTNELNLVSEIMCLIERYHDDHGTAPRPDQLRDTMLTLAVLLHSEAIRIGSTQAKAEPLSNSFIERALECLAKLVPPSSGGPFQLLHQSLSH